MSTPPQTSVKRRARAAPARPPRRTRAPGPSWVSRLGLSGPLVFLAASFVSGSALAAEDAPPRGLAGDQRLAQASATTGDQRVVQLNEQGSALYAAGDFRRAVELFIQAYAVDQDPNLLFNIGSCYEGLGDVEAALEKYRAFLDAPNADPEGRPRAERAIERLMQASAAPAPEERPVEPSPAPPVQASPASTSEAGPPSWSAWVGLGGGAVLGAAGVTLYLLGAADHADVTSAEGYGDSTDVVSFTRSEADDLVRSGDAKKTAGVAAAAAGGALLAGYLVWWLLDPPSNDAPPAVQASADGSSATLTFSGHF
jgi:tetratricopeptide (TPR) repeat protein